MTPLTYCSFSIFSSLRELWRKHIVRYNANQNIGDLMQGRKSHLNHGGPNKKVCRAEILFSPLLMARYLSSMANPAKHTTLSLLPASSWYSPRFFVVLLQGSA